MTTTTFERLRAILVKDYQIAPEAITPEAPLASLGIDSLGVAELLFNIEDEFKISLPPEPVDLPTIEAVVRFIEALAAAQQGVAARPGHDALSAPQTP